jgi:hypothetical protein
MYLKKKIRNNDFNKRNPLCNNTNNVVLDTRRTYYYYFTTLSNTVEKWFQKRSLDDSVKLNR